MRRADQADRARLGQGRSGVSPAVHEPDLSERDARAGALVQRAAAHVVLARSTPRSSSRASARSTRRRTSPQVACPTLVLHTRGDMCAPFDEGLFIASSIPGARLVPLETRSHVPMPGEPSFDRVIEEIEAFIGSTRDGKPAFPELTRRERQILEHIARGHDNAQIAAHLELVREDRAQSHHAASSTRSASRTARRRSCRRAKPASPEPA